MLYLAGIKVKQFLAFFSSDASAWTIMDGSIGVRQDKHPVLLVVYLHAVDQFYRIIAVSSMTALIIRPFKLAWHFISIFAINVLGISFKIELMEAFLP